MKRLFFVATLALAAFEVAQVWFIMPFPGSQGLSFGLPLAYALHAWRWPVRIALGVGVLASLPAVWRSGARVVPALALIVAGGVTWLFNFQITADHMFREPAQLAFAGAADNRLPPDALVIGVASGNEAKAYPIRFLAYHHQVRDSVGGRAVMVTYCSVCRSGRVFEPAVSGQPETFRLVGMDNFNAMFEDAGTKTWWRQATGRAVAGPLAGSALTAVDADQLTVAQWLARHPQGVVMQPDAASLDEYDPQARYERGESRGDLTRTDRASWQDKSWVVGVQLGDAEKAYDWNRLAREHVINDELGGKPIVVALANDGQSFAAFERPTSGPMRWDGGRLCAGDRTWDVSGRAADGPPLKRIAAYQEFWHSWRTFHPGTLRDG